MAAFQYQAMNSGGVEQKGVMEGDSARHIRQLLREQNLTPISVTELSRGKPQQKQRGGVSQRRYKISVAELALLTRQLATLISASLPLEEVILGVANQAEKAKIKTLLLAVRAKVLEGHTLSEGLALFPQSFSELYRATVAAGEQSGHLDTVLLRLADYTEQQQHMRQKVQQALFYPAIMSCVSLAIVVFLLIFVVPKMIAVFSSTHQILPLVTVILISISHGLQHYGIYLLIALIVLFFIARQSYKQTSVKVAVHHFILRLPIIGKSVKAVNTARFSRTFGILSSAGVPVLEAMRISAELISNIPIRSAVETATLRVREGANIHLALKQTGYFPPMSIHLIASGEATGQLEDMLQRAANNQEKDVERLIENILTLFEPVMILIMGSFVLFIVMAIMLPIFNMDQLS